MRLRPGVSLPRYTAAAEALAKRLPASSGGQVFVADESTQVAAIERSIRPQAVALALFALALALTALLIVGQVAARLLIAAASDNGALGALGMTRRQLAAASLAEVAITAVTGAAGACAIAVAASPLTPIGPARLAERDPGISLNLPVLVIGFAAISVLLTARVTVTAWRRASAHPGTGDGYQTADRRSKTAERLASAGAPLAAVTGVRFALDPGYGRASVPVRSAVLGLAVAVAAVAGAGTFGANLLRLVDTPSLYGQDWDIALEGQFGTRDGEAVHPDHRARARHHRRDVRRARHGHHRQDRHPGDRPRAGNRPGNVLDRARRPSARHRRRDRARRLGAAPARTPGRPDGHASARRRAPARC